MTVNTHVDTNQTGHHPLGDGHVVEGIAGAGAVAVLQGYLEHHLGVQVPTALFVTC